MTATANLRSRPWRTRGTHASLVFPWPASSNLVAVTHPASGSSSSDSTGCASSPGPDGRSRVSCSAPRSRSALRSRSARARSTADRRRLVRRQCVRESASARALCAMPHRASDTARTAYPLLREPRVVRGGVEPPTFRFSGLGISVYARPLTSERLLSARRWPDVDVHERACMRLEMRL
jgi:hypothetical protein